MQSFIFRLTVAIVTFAVGIIISDLSSFRYSPESEHYAGRPDETLSNSHSQKQFATLKPHMQAADGADLSIVVRVNNEPPSFTVRPIKFSKDRPIIIELDPGEDIDDQEVVLAAGDNSVHYRIFQRYRTSMTVMAEGPHLDLLDWRHFDSNWKLLQRLDARRFRTLASDQMEASKFPRTTKPDMINAVRRKVGNGWSDILERVKTCLGPNDGWCAVMISSVYLRIQKKVNDRWINIGLVEFRIPMGC